MNYLFAVFMALVAYSCISIGFVLMKKGIHWIGWKGKRDKVFFWNLFIWITGFIIMNIYGVPSAVALNKLPPHVVAAFAGWGIVVLVFLSGFFLKETLFKTDYIFSMFIVIGICLLNVFEKNESTTNVDTFGLVLLCGLPVILFLIGFLPRFSDKAKSVFFGVCSGISAGLMVVFLKLLVAQYQFQILLYMKSLYLYLYIGFALISFVALQVACKKGPMMIIGPVQYSTNIIYPVFAAFLVFGGYLHIVQFLSIGLIVFSVIYMLKKR